MAHQEREFVIGAYIEPEGWLKISARFRAKTARTIANSPTALAMEYLFFSNAWKTGRQEVLGSWGQRGQHQRSQGKKLIEPRYGRASLTDRREPSAARSSDRVMKKSFEFARMIRPTHENILAPRCGERTSL